MAFAQKEDHSLQVAIRRRQVQGCPVVIIRHPCLHACFNHLPNLLMVVLSRRLAQRNPELDVAHLGTLTSKQLLYSHMFMANSIIQRCLAKAVERAQVQIAELQHAGDGFQMPIGGCEVQGSAVIIISQVGVHTDYLHQQLQLWGVPLRRRLAELHCGRHTTLEFSAGLNEKLRHFCASLSDSIIQRSVAESVFGHEIGRPICHEPFRHGQVAFTHGDVQCGPRVPVPSIHRDLAVLEHNLHVVPLPLGGEIDEVIDALLRFCFCGLVDHLPDSSNPVKIQVMDPQVSHQVSRRGSRQGPALAPIRSRLADHVQRNGCAFRLLPQTGSVRHDLQHIVVD
mmetsp:Transcript_27705/g.65789  ORF Transcript_27705/g.65789 Transcript_27705/m.65789 type:complete len:339 (-) Transcript_27705:1677-2693(-)